MTTSLLLSALVALPGLTFLILSMGWLLGWAPGEKAVARLAAVTAILDCVLAAALSWKMIRTGDQQTIVRFGEWFKVGSYEFSLDLMVDWLSLPLIGLALILAGLIGAFSRRYLHRDRGFHRFYVLLQLFTFGAVLVFARRIFRAPGGRLGTGGCDQRSLSRLFLRKARPRS